MERETPATIEWRHEVAPAEWLADRFNPFFSDTGSVIPTGFEAYARLFHPVDDGDFGDPPRRWADVALSTGRIVHREMQFHMISRPVGCPPPDRYEQGQGPEWGSLPLPERRALVSLLRPATTTPARCWFCVWDGFGGLDDQGVTERVRLPHRDYLFCAGPVELALMEQSPNLWWPDDRAWCVATEVDYAWTYVGGTRRLIYRLLEDERLEALPAQLTDKPFYDSDLLNAALDLGSRRT